MYSNFHGNYYTVPWWSFPMAAVASNKDVKKCIGSTIQDEAFGIDFWTYLFYMQKMNLRRVLSILYIQQTTVILLKICLEECP